MAQTPRIVYSPLSKSWYVTTRYRVKQFMDAATGTMQSFVIATTKYDVTDQMEAILSPAGQRAVKCGKTPTRVFPKVEK